MRRVGKTLHRKQKGDSHHFENKKARAFARAFF
jgi:hypothetical protein